MALTGHREFWSKQTSSLNRPLSDAELSEKAAEHASVMTLEDRSAGCIDLGCGAGELLGKLVSQVKVCVGLDYSDSMLETARGALNDEADIEFLNADVFTYLPASEHAVWMTTGALNQYLDGSQMDRLLQTFRSNPTARSFYLFDCIDFVRYQLLPWGSSYRHAAGDPGLRRLYRRIVFAFRFALGRWDQESVRFPSVGMGYGYLPSYWIRNANKHGFKFKIVSSRFYEYRYHVVLQK